MRYFRSSTAVYAGICQQLDAEYGYPNEATKTERTLPLAETLPADEAGRVYLAIQDEFCDYLLPSELLPQLMAAGLVEEVTVEQYSALMPTPPTLP
jgi:hypothetical protein